METVVSLLGMDTRQILKEMDKDTVANSVSFAGVFSYLMQFQGEITILLLITGLMLNVMRILDRFNNKKKGDH